MDEDDDDEAEGMDLVEAAKEVGPVPFQRGYATYERKVERPLKKKSTTEDFVYAALTNFDLNESGSVMSTPWNRLMLPVKCFYDLTIKFESQTSATKKKTGGIRHPAHATIRKAQNNRSTSITGVWQQREARRREERAHGAKTEKTFCFAF